MAQHLDGKWPKKTFRAVACTEIRFYCTNGQKYFVTENNYQTVSDVVPVYVYRAHVCQIAEQYDH